MWRDNFLRIFNESKLTPKQLADKSLVSENTIKRIIKNPNITIRLDTLEQLVKCLGLTLKDITNDTNSVIGNEKLEVLQREKDEIQANYNILLAEMNTVSADKSSLEKDVITLKGKIETLEMKLMYTEKLLAVYEKFDKFKSE